MPIIMHNYVDITCDVMFIPFFVMFSRIPMKTYSLIAFLTVATMGLSNSSLGYLNYPTQVIFKCCKLIPVLVGGIIIQGSVFTI